jgi:hypothetical protein
MDKLYDDLRNDYILSNELDRSIGYGYLKMGVLTAVASTSLITFSNVGKKIPNINEEGRSKTSRGEISNNDSN